MLADTQTARVSRTGRAVRPSEDMGKRPGADSILGIGYETSFQAVVVGDSLKTVGLGSRDSRRGAGSGDRDPYVVGGAVLELLRIVPNLRQFLLCVAFCCSMLPVGHQYDEIMFG